MSQEQEPPVDDQSLERLRQFIIDKADDSVHGVRLERYYKLLDRLCRQLPKGVPVSELPAGLSDPETLRAADEDGLIEFGHRVFLSRAEDGRITRFDSREYRHVAHPQPGSDALRWGGKSMPQILAEFADEDSRKESCEGYHPDVRWHVRLADAVRKAFADWKSSELHRRTLPADDGGGGQGGADDDNEWVTAAQIVEKGYVTSQGQLSKRAGRNPAIRRAATDVDRRRLTNDRIRYVYNARLIYESTEGSPGD